MSSSCRTVSSRMSSSSKATSHSTAMSTSTQSLVEKMMKNSKLTKSQQKEFKRAMEDSTALPLNCPPNSTEKAIDASIMNKRGAQQARFSRKYVTTGKRSVADIRSTDAYKRDVFRPTPVIDREKEKIKLQEVMIYGKEGKPKEKKMTHTSIATTDCDMDEFDMIMDEIVERREFLEEMTAMGKGKEYEAQIQREISLRVSRLERLDRERNSKLRELEELATNPNL